jgi:hypothetical protein
MKKLVWASTILLLLQLQACGDRQFSLKSVFPSKPGTLQKAEPQQLERPEAGEKNKLQVKAQDPKEDLSFEILGQKLVVRFVELKKTSQGDKTVVTSKITLNGETLSLVTDHDQYHEFTARDIHSESLPYSLHISARCELKSCERYLMVVMLLKDKEAGNPEAFREFGLLYLDQSKSAILALNNKSPNDLGTMELMELLKERASQNLKPPEK